MGHSLILSINIIIIILIECIQSQSQISCFSSACGPCSNQLAPCNLKCHGYEDCKDSLLSCTSGDASECTIDCDGEKSCLGTLVEATETSKLDINCNHEGSCESAIIYSGIGTDVTLNCGGLDGGCEDLTLYAQNSNNVNIKCNNFHSCHGLTLFCGTGECIIDCSLGDNACKSMILYCESSSKCQINCSGLDSCTGSVGYHTTNAKSFECIGTAAQCLGAPAPFSIPTSSPTISPTDKPTSKPTKLPTTNTPTTRPTLPKIIPTLSPLTNTNTNPISSTKSVTTMTSTPTPTIKSSTSTTVDIIPSVSDPNDDTLKPTTSSSTSSPTIALEATVGIISDNPTETNLEMFPDSTMMTSDRMDSRDDDIKMAEEKSGSSSTFYIYVMLICIGIAILICCCVPLCICLCNKICGSDGNHKKQKDSPDSSTISIDGTRVKSLSIDGPKWNEFTIPSNLSIHKSRQSMLEYQQHHHHIPEKEINENLSHHIENSESNDMDIYTWFNEKVKLPQYAERFISNGFSDLSLIQQLVNMEEIEKMGIKRLDHRLQIMAEINKLHSIMSPIVMGTEESDEPSDISNVNVNININAPKIKLGLIKQHGLHSNTQTRTRTPKYNCHIANDEFIIHGNDDDDMMESGHEETIMGNNEHDNDRAIQRMLTPHAHDYYGRHNKLNSHDILALEISQMEDDMDEDSIDTLNSPQVYIEHKIKGVSIQKIMNEDIYEYGNRERVNYSIHGERFSLDSNGVIRNALMVNYAKMPNRASILTNQFSEGKDDDRQIDDVLNEVDEVESEVIHEMVTFAAAPHTPTSSDLFGNDRDRNTPR